MMIGDQPLPHDLEIEKSVLGMLILDLRETAPIACRKLRHDGMFYDQRHSLIFNSIMRLAENAMDIDMTLLCNELERVGFLEDVGGRAYVLDVANSTASVALFEKYADTLVDMAVKRKMIAASVDTMMKCYDVQCTAKDIIDDAGASLTEIAATKIVAKVRPIGETVLEALEFIEATQAGDTDKIGLSWGYGRLDDLLLLRPGEMIVVAGRPSLGKTAFAVNIAENLAVKRGIPVGMFSLEMSQWMLTVRMMCAGARVNIKELRGLSQSKWQELLEAGARLKEAPFYVDDSSDCDIMDIRTTARQMKREYGIRIVMVDYLQFVKAIARGVTQNREVQVAEISRNAKAMARELELPVVILAQLNRQAESGEGPRVSQLRESGAIEQDADVIALLNRGREPEPGAEGIEAELIVAKNRNGPTGIVPFTFFPKWTRFEERSRIDDEDVPYIVEPKDWSYF